jgi:hypothetical protein
MPPTQRIIALKPICAYLIINMQIAKAILSFSETIKVQSVITKKFYNIISINNRDKVF